MSSSIESRCGFLMRTGPPLRGEGQSRVSGRLPPARASRALVLLTLLLGAPSAASYCPYVLGRKGFSIFIISFVRLSSFFDTTLLEVPSR